MVSADVELVAHVRSWAGREGSGRDGKRLYGQWRYVELAAARVGFSSKFSVRYPAFCPQKNLIETYLQAVSEDRAGASSAAKCLRGKSLHLRSEENYS